MTGMQDDTVDVPEWSNLFEVIILGIGAIIGGLLTLGFALFIGRGTLQASPSYRVEQSWCESIAGILFMGLIFLVPAGGALICAKGLRSSQARWPFFASMYAAVIGASVMFIGVGIGWSYHPDEPKMPGILLMLGAGAIAALPFILIAILRLRKNNKRQEGALAPTGKQND